MDIKTIIETIKQSIITDTSSHVKIVDRSMLSELLSPPHRDGTQPRIKDLPPKQRPAAVARRVLHSRRFNLLLLLIALFTTGFLLILMGLFFIDDVLFHPYNTSVNSGGALTLEQPGERQHYMYLYNSATPWADTGIGLIEGDHVTISVSGAYHSDISMLSGTAKKNIDPKYHYINPGYDRGKGAKLNEAESDESQFQFAPNLRFGELLYQVTPQGSADNYNRGRQFDSSQIIDSYLDDGTIQFDVDSPGTLRFAINDIYLDSATINKMWVSEGKISSDALESFMVPISRHLKADTIVKVHIPEADHKEVDMDAIIARHGLKDLTGSSYITFDNKLAVNLDIVASKQNMLDYFQNKECKWFEDNCGELLINVKIDRNLSSNPRLTWYDKMFVWGYRSLEPLYTWIFS